MKSKAILSGVIGALAAAFVTLPAHALPAVAGKLTATSVNSSVQTAHYGEARRGHHRGIRLFFGGGQGRQWGNHGGGSRNHVRRNHDEGRSYRGYSEGYSQHGNHRNR